MRWSWTFREGSSVCGCLACSMPAPHYQRRMPRPRPRPLPRMPMGPPRPGMGPPPPAPSGGCDRGLRTVSSTDRIYKYAHAQATQYTPQLIDWLPWDMLHIHAILCLSSEWARRRLRAKNYHGGQAAFLLQVVRRAHQTGSLCCRSDSIGLHKRWLPDKGPICVHNTACINDVEVRHKDAMLSCRTHQKQIFTMSYSSSALKNSLQQRSHGLCMVM